MTTTLTLPRWPRVLDGLRVAVLADLHVGSPWNGVDDLARVIERTNAAGADLVLLAGDYVVTTVLGGTFVPPETTADALRALHERAASLRQSGHRNEHRAGALLRAAGDLRGDAPTRR